LAITLAEIARQVGVDVSLVSRVLRDDAGAKLSPTKRAQILAIAKATGYRPNRLGRSLRTGRTSIIGMLTPDITNAFHAIMFRGVEAAAAAAGYDTILCNTDDSPERFKEVVSVLSEGHVDGILVATARAYDESIDWLAKADVPYLLVNRRRDQDDELWIGPDDFQTGWLGAAHLLELGHRRIAFLLLDLDVGNNLHRLAGIKAALAEFGCDPKRCWIKTDIGDRAGGKRYVRDLLALPRSERPTAIFAPHTILGDAVVHATYQAGFRMPGDLSVIGYTASSEPDFTCIRVPLDEIGRLATENLIKLLNGEKHLVSLPDQEIAVNLIDMGSTAPPP
jgi:LacI family transcriptional regulator, galactose operon repressor